MPQLHTSLYFHLTPIVMINGSSCRREPVICLKARGSRNRRALILGWAYYLDAFSYPPALGYQQISSRGHDKLVHRRCPSRPLSHY
ncbi:hypothetical protein H5410_056286 [Solanum commersonii]|uniref:Uncharacterized protein n=1 Tax=Solanum commersonii TaxID=4109 RepID=A0A9J5WMA6_SOLCO|nr:hypothetical protein H5410_056286 [Solanum commersonii]